MSTEKLIKDYFAATRAMDVEAWLANFAEDAVSEDPVGGNLLVGHHAMRQFFLSITSLFEQVGLTEDFVHIVGKEAAVKFTGKGVGKNGKAVTFEGIDVFEFNDAGLIQSLKAYWNPAAAIADLQT
jgi:steroid Delta-isomerase